MPTTNGDGPDPGESDQELPGPRAAYAVNWWVVLGVDAAMGLVVALAGLVAMIVWPFWLGAAARPARLPVRGARWPGGPSTGGACGGRAGL